MNYDGKASAPECSCSAPTIEALQERRRCHKNSAMSGAVYLLDDLDLRPGEIKPYATGLKMVAGDPHATRGQPWLDPDESPTAFWRCVSIGNDGNR
jgi:hypothetical protein